MNLPNKEQIHGIVGTLIFHLIVLLILLLVVMSKPQQQQEAGVAVVMGTVAEASGDAYEYTEVKPYTPPSTPKMEPKASSDEPFITQDDEPSIELPDTKKNAPKKEKTKEELEAEKRAREELRRKQEAERLAREANDKIAGAFGKGSTMVGQGESKQGRGVEGSLEGNDAKGIKTGVGGYGTFDLNGRSLGKGGLPRPVYNVQDEGRVVVNITVNSQGRVIQTSINGRTNTVNAALRSAALKAAAEAVFNEVDGVNNQMGTITYYFKLK